MDEEISVIDLSENAMNTEGYHNEQINASDSKPRETSLPTINTPSDDSKVEYSKHDGQNNISNTNDLVNHSTEDETKFQGATDDEINVGSNPHNYFNAFIIIGVIMVCVFPLMVITLIPRDNSLFYPDSWYVSAILYVFVYSTLLSLENGMEVTIYTGTTSRITIGMFLKFYLSIMIACSLVCYTCYFIHTTYNGYHLPVPALYVWLMIGTLVVRLIAPWIISPEELRATKAHKKNLQFFALLQIYLVFVLSIQMQFLEWEFEKASYNWQWVAAILIVLAREVNNWILSKILTKFSQNQSELANVMLDVTVSSIIGSQIAVQLALANNLAIVSFLFVEFLLHIWTSYQVTKLHRKPGPELTANEISKQKKEKLQRLVLDEIIEVLVLIVYAIGVELAYHGPNQTIFKTLWDSQEFDDNDLLGSMFMMVALEILGFLVCAFILNSYCKINLFIEFCDAMKNFWFIVALRLGFTIFIYFANNDLNLGIDETFDWYSDEGRRRIILSSSDLSNEEKFCILNKTLV